MTPNASWDQCKALAEKHTDGPWEACAPGDYGDFDGESRVVCSADPDDMRRIAVVHWSERHPETDANAHLIAAAPELLEALESARRIIREVDEYQKRPESGDWGVECACCMGELLVDDREAIASIDAAIAKARGQS